MGIVARVRRDGLSSAPLQSRPVSGRCYLVTVVSCHLSCPDVSGHGFGSASCVSGFDRGAPILGCRNFACRKPSNLIGQSAGAAGSAGGCGDGSVGRVPVVWGRATRGARFCDACGTALMASALAAEYKQVTMLFADVVRSMDIAAAREERLRES